MKREICLERVWDETRLAVLEDGKLCMYLSERGGAAGLSGNIYAGRVRNILPGMNAAFVDIGVGKNAYLAAQDAGAERIEKSLRAGDMIVCQVDKEPGGSKGPRITMNISLTGRNVVLLPNESYAGVSKKIADEEERDRLHGIAKQLSSESGMGVILRTESFGVSFDELRDEYEDLIERWNGIRERGCHSAVPELINRNGDLALYAVRELLRDDVDSLITDDAVLYESLKSHAARFTPKLADRIVYRPSETPIFQLMRVDRQLERALERRVDLKSGGTLVIDECEALTVIDVNTSRFVGSGSVEETIFELNLEAAREIVRQIRLRDLGGIIIADFIDMRTQEERERLLEYLRELLRADPNRTAVLGMTQLGLVEMSRKKVRRPLSKRMMRDCPLCSGSGRILRTEETAMQAARELYRRRKSGDETAYKLIVGPHIAEYLPECMLSEDKRLTVATDMNEHRYRFIPLSKHENEV